MFFLLIDIGLVIAAAMERSPLLILAALCTLAGCAVVEPEKSPVGGDRPAPGMALVYFYREARFTGSMAGIQISDRGKPIGDLGNGTYFVHQANPGEHLFIRNGHTEDATPVRLEAGKTYYMRCTVDAWALTPHWLVENVHLSGLPDGLERVRWMGR
jgi:hypothetical protein